MGRKKDPIWKYAEKLEDGFKCKFCQAEFVGGAGASRIKVHLAKYRGKGIEICARVTPEAQADARLALDAKKSKSKSTSTPGKKKKKESKVY